MYSPSVLGLDIPSQISPNFVVLGGGWEQSDHSPAMLSMEARMRIIALGVLADRGLVEHAIFSGGIESPDSHTAEATDMIDYFRERFTGLRGVTLHAELKSYDTTTNAQNVGALADQLDLQPPFTLITSNSHLKRSSKIFAHAGLDVVPLAAENVFAQQSDHHAAFAHRYTHSSRQSKKIIAESALRTLALVDRDGAFIRRIAGRTRQH